MDKLHVCIWPSREQIAKIMPSSMKEKYPNVRCIIDCVEFKIETPSSLVLHKMMYSDYKSHTTVKTLVRIAPGVVLHSFQTHILEAFQTQRLL